ncbi:MAG: class I SAM-dependent methyltransferase [Chloroflexi bacterium]|nr:class I SAM-dependent methyltransferase [Chloroflexota bacterium]
MQPDVADRLRRINREFYQSFAAPFAATRRRLQPGAAALLERLPRQASIIDLGCGSGEVARALRRRGHQGAYLGLDECAPLLEQARTAGLPQAEFAAADLADPAWTALARPPCDWAVAFSVLHHLPGPTRPGFLAGVRSVLAPEGFFAFSVWQFQHSERLTRRIVPWASVGLDPSQVDAGDHLIDWRHGGRGLRYVHAFDSAELEALARQTGFHWVERFESDGRGGRLGLYAVWSPDGGFEGALGRQL